MLALTFLLLIAGPAQSQGFSNISGASGTDDGGTSFGAGFADYDLDGLPDLYVSGSNTLFHNDGGGVFSVATTLAVTKPQGVFWGDYDNDGDPDLLTTWNLQLFQNDAAVLVDMDELAAGLTGPTNLGCANWVDFDRDGDLDVWAPDGTTNNFMFAGDGAGGFVSSTPSGLHFPGDGETTAQGDIDNDGDTDLLLRLGAGYLWLDQGNQTFLESRYSLGLDLFESTGGAVGQAFADFDNDGDLDLYAGSDGGNTLYENVGGTFVDITNSAGVAGSPLVTNGVSWADFDNDGHLDLYVSQAGGHNHLYQNLGNKAFADMADTYGVRGGAGDDSSAARWADIDLDGDLDLFVGRIDGKNKFFENDQDDNEYLKVWVSGMGPGGAPVDGTGSWVELWDAGDTTLLASRQVGGTEGYGSSATRMQHFGLRLVGGYQADFLVRVHFSGGGYQQCLVSPDAASIQIGPSTLFQTVSFNEADGDGDGDGRPAWCDRCANFDDDIDTDGDSQPDGCDPCPLDSPDDSDGDGWCDSDEFCLGDPDYDDEDGDGLCGDLDDCIGADASGDADLDGHCLLASDGASYWDCDDADPFVFPGTLELSDGIDNTCDGLVDDTDGDGLHDEDEWGDPDDPFDADGDGLPDHEDPDDDADGIPTTDELDEGAPVDTDGDGDPDHLDTDSDGDGIPDADEGAGDDDCDGVENRLDAVDDALCDPGASPGGDDREFAPDATEAAGSPAYSCSCQTGSSPSFAWATVLLLGLRRRR